MTVEKLIGCEVPKRAKYIRVILMELARIADHIICDSVIAVDTGALTGFYLSFPMEREKFMKFTKRSVEPDLQQTWAALEVWSGFFGNGMEKLSAFSTAFRSFA